MFQMNFNESVNRYVQFEGMIHYYKHGWLSNKWTIVYAKLWSDSTLEWFHNKGSDKPIGSILLGSVIPYICIGSQVRKVPSKKPKVEASWDRNFLMAVASDQKASSVYWFYFDDGANLRKWLSEITRTLPRVNASGTGNDRSMPTQNAFAAPRMPPMNDFRFSRRDNNRKRSSFDDLFDDTMMNYGLGSHFFTMDFPDSSSSSDSDDEIRRHGHSKVFHDDGRVHISQHGDATVIGINARDETPHPNEFGSGFTRVHHVEL